MASIKLKGDTSGEITIDVPAVAGANTLTLPANTGTVITSATTAADVPAPTQLSTASGSAPSYSARAWALFNGTGTVSLTESGNVSSITDQGTGLYDVNFTTAMPDANFAAVASSEDPNFATNNVVLFTYDRTTSKVRIKSTASNGTEYDMDEISVIVMR